MCSFEAENLFREREHRVHESGVARTTDVEASVRAIALKRLLPASAMAFPVAAF